SRIFSRLTASIVATLTLSRLAGERASTVDRCPQPRMIVHQSSGVLSGCVPGSATTTGSLTPHSTRRARSGSGSTILFQGLIDLNSSGSAWRTASQNFSSAGSNILAPPNRDRKVATRADKTPQPSDRSLKIGNEKNPEDAYHSIEGLVSKGKTLEVATPKFYFRQTAFHS